MGMGDGGKSLKSITTVGPMNYLTRSSATAQRTGR